MDSQPFVLRGDFITLDALLKATGLAASGGAAKAMIVGSEVRVDGAVELRRGAKLRAGQTVQVHGRAFCLKPAGLLAGSAAGTSSPT